MIFAVPSKKLMSPHPCVLPPNYLPPPALPPTRPGLGGVGPVGGPDEGGLPGIRPLDVAPLEGGELATEIHGPVLEPGGGGGGAK